MSMQGPVKGEPSWSDAAAGVAIGGGLGGSVANWPGWQLAQQRRRRSSSSGGNAAGSGPAAQRTRPPPVATAPPWQAPHTTPLAAASHMGGVGGQFPLPLPGNAVLPRASWLLQPSGGSRSGIDALTGIVGLPLGSVVAGGGILQAADFAFSEIALPGIAPMPPAGGGAGGVILQRSLSGRPPISPLSLFVPPASAPISRSNGSTLYHVALPLPAGTGDGHRPADRSPLLKTQTSFDEKRLALLRAHAMAESAKLVGCESDPMLYCAKAPQLLVLGQAGVGLPAAAGAGGQGGSPPAAAGVRQSPARRASLGPGSNPHAHREGF